MCLAAQFVRTLILVDYSMCNTTSAVVAFLLLFTEALETVRRVRSKTFQETGQYAIRPEVGHQILNNQIIRQ